jgi:soluble lytic murein transglycosylase-like protein
MTKILKRSQLVYLPKIGFVSRLKLIVSALLVVLAVASCVAPTTAHARPNTMTVGNSLQDKMVAYMKRTNKSISNKVAYDLANAMLIQHYKYGIPVEVMLGQSTIESRFDQFAIGDQGELGFFQVHTKWHADRLRGLMKVGVIKTKNIYDPLTNTSVGMSKLGECMRKHGGSVQKGLMCYNGTGDGAVAYSKKVIAASKEVQKYI